VRDGAREVQLVTAMSKQVGAKVSQRLTLTGGKVEAVGCWAGRAQKVLADGAAVGIRITAQPLEACAWAWGVVTKGMAEMRLRRKCCQANVAVDRPE
jgi:hypothetical protein